MIADTTCNPDQAITQARRLVHQEKVHFMIGPLCGHEGPAVAQVSKETGVPLVMDTAGADNVTNGTARRPWCAPRCPRARSAIRSATISTRNSALRNVTFIGQDYTWGHEVTLGAVRDLQGRSAARSRRSSGTRSAPRTTAPTVASIAPGSDAVVAVVVGADRIRLFEAWFSFGMDKKFKIYGGYWMHQDALPQMDDRAVGMIGNSLHYAAGLDTPENKAFVDAFAKKHKRLPSWFSESAYTASLWTRTAIEQIKGNVEDRAAFLKAMRSVEVKAPRGPLKLDDYDNPIQNVYISRIQKIKHPVVGEVLTNVPIKTYENVSQFWTWTPEEFLKRGPYKR